MRARRGSIYLAVLIVVSAVTVLVLVGVALRKEINDRARTGVDMGEATRLARAGAELAAQQADNSLTTFRTTAATGKVYTGLTLGTGRISATVTDTATGLTPTASTTSWDVVADATVGQARSRLKVTLEQQEDDYRRLAEELGAVSYWPADEAAGTAVAEDVFGDHDGVYGNLNAAGLRTHVHGGIAPRIEWVNEYIRVPHNSAFEITNGTICFWVRFDAIPSIGGVQCAAVVKEDNSSTTEPDFAIWIQSSGLYYKLNNSSGPGNTINCSISKLTQGVWAHVAASWGDTGMQLFVNGKRVAQDGAAVMDLAVSGSRPACKQDWYFGVRNQPFLIYSQYWPTSGSVARVALFPSQLTEAQVDALYQSLTVPDDVLPVQGSYARVVD